MWSVPVGKSPLLWCRWTQPVIRILCQWDQYSTLSLILWRPILIIATCSSCILLHRQLQVGATWRWLQGAQHNYSGVTQPPERCHDIVITCVILSGKIPAWKPDTLSISFTVRQTLLLWFMDHLVLHLKRVKINVRFVTRPLPHFMASHLVCPSWFVFLSGSAGVPVYLQILLLLVGSVWLFSLLLSGWRGSPIAWQYDDRYRYNKYVLTISIKQYYCNGVRQALQIVVSGCFLGSSVTMTKVTSVLNYTILGAFFSQCWSEGMFQVVDFKAIGLNILGIRPSSQPSIFR